MRAPVGQHHMSHNHSGNHLRIHFVGARDAHSDFPGKSACGDNVVSLVSWARKAVSFAPPRHFYNILPCRSKLVLDASHDTAHGTELTRMTGQPQDKQTNKFKMLQPHKWYC